MWGECHPHSSSSSSFCFNKSYHTQLNIDFSQSHTEIWPHLPILNPTQHNPWMDPTHVLVCERISEMTIVSSRPLGPKPKSIQRFHAGDNVPGPTGTDISCKLIPYITFTFTIHYPSSWNPSVPQILHRGLFVFSGQLSRTRTRHYWCSNVIDGRLHEDIMHYAVWKGKSWLRNSDLTFLVESYGVSSVCDVWVSC